MLGWRKNDQDPVLSRSLQDDLVVRGKGLAQATYFFISISWHQRKALMPMSQWTEDQDMQLNLWWTEKLQAWSWSKTWMQGVIQVSWGFFCQRVTVILLQFMPFHSACLHRSERSAISWLLRVLPFWWVVRVWYFFVDLWSALISMLWCSVFFFTILIQNVENAAYVGLK
jgi:hypothetical protein